jgi:molybdopterin converting factor small subunit
MRVNVHFYSYFAELTGCRQSAEILAPGATVAALLAQLWQRYPRLEPMKRSTLVAVGLDYQLGDYVLQEGDEVSLFPPVQGG